MNINNIFMYLKDIIYFFTFLSFINFIYCDDDKTNIKVRKVGEKFKGKATEYGINDEEEWEISDLEFGYCNKEYMEKKVKNYGIDINQYIITMNKKDVKKMGGNIKEEYFDPSSKTVAINRLMRVDSSEKNKNYEYSNCGDFIKVNYNHKNVNNTIIVLITDKCGNCEDNQIDLPYETWNLLYGENTYKEGNIAKNSKGEIPVSWSILSLEHDKDLIKNWNKNLKK